MVEILSPHDESRDKLPFYASLGVGEVWLIDPLTRGFERYAGRSGLRRIRDEGELGIALTIVNGPRLRVGWRGLLAEI